MTPEEFAKIEAGLTALGNRAATVIQGLTEALGSFMAGYVEQVRQERDRLIRQHDQAAARNAALTTHLADALRGQLGAHEEHDRLLHSLRQDQPAGMGRPTIRAAAIRLEELSRFRHGQNEGGDAHYPDWLNCRSAVCAADRRIVADLVHLAAEGGEAR